VAGVGGAERFLSSISTNDFSDIILSARLYASAAMMMCLCASGHSKGNPRVSVAEYCRVLQRVAVCCSACSLTRVGREDDVLLCV